MRDRPDGGSIKTDVVIERLFENLALSVEPFAVCEVSRGWRLRMDGLEWVTFHFVLRGAGGLRTARGQRLPLGTACLAVVPPRLSHSLESGESVTAEATTSEALHPGELLEFLAGPRGVDDLVVACGRVQVTYAGSLGLFDRLREPIVLDFSDSRDMVETFERLLDEERARSPGGRAMMAALISQCLVLIFRRLSDSVDTVLPWLEGLDDPRLADVVAMVLDEPERPHTLDSLAAQAFMSRSAFAERFAARFGRTPMAFVRDVRLRRGAELLRATDLPVDVVARRVGFASRSHFSRAFREHFGTSPGRFRALGAGA